MSKDQTIFRNNSQKCVFNNFGFCKFQLECRSYHSKKVCEDNDCNTKCVDRHPKLCRNKERCKFFKKKICAFSHNASEKENYKDRGKVEVSNDKIDELKNLVSKNEQEFENKIKILTNSINIERKKNEDSIKVQKELLKKNDDLEIKLKKEVKELNLKLGKLEKSKQDLEFKLENKQSILSDGIKKQLKSCQEKITDQKKILKEMLAKEKDYEAEVKDIVNINKIEIGKLKEEVFRVKNKPENVVNCGQDFVEDSASKTVVKELMGRNVTIVKTNPENQNPKTVEANIELIDKPKPKRTKITKKVIEDRLIAAYVWDAELMVKDFSNSELESMSQECKKCEFDTISEGMLKRHKVLIHDSNKETNQSIILGFEADVQRHCKVLEIKGQSLEHFKCEECDYKIYSSGKLTLHQLTTHQG